MSASNVAISTLASIGNFITNYFGLNMKNFSKVYKQSPEIRARVDKIAEEYLRKFEDKLATTSPSTAPSLARFIQTQLQKDKDVVLALQRQVQIAADAIDVDRDRVAVDADYVDKLDKDIKDAESNFNQGISNIESSNPRRTAIIRGSENRFTNARNYDKWKENNINEKKK